jgi:hypothetical protein
LTFWGKLRTDFRISSPGLTLTLKPSGLIGQNGNHVDLSIFQAHAMIAPVK